MDRIRVHVPAGSPLDGTTYRVWPESGATTYWTDVAFTSPERQGLEDAFADLRLTLEGMRVYQAMYALRDRVAALQADLAAARASGEAGR